VTPLHRQKDSKMVEGLGHPLTGRELKVAIGDVNTTKAN